MGTGCFDDLLAASLLPASVESLPYGFVLLHVGGESWCNLEAQRLLGLFEPRLPLSAWRERVTFHELDGAPLDEADAPAGRLLRGERWDRRCLTLHRRDGARLTALVDVRRLSPESGYLLLSEQAASPTEAHSHDAWVGAISHELRGALQVLNLAVFTRSFSKEPAVQQRSDGAIRRAMGVLTRLIDDLADTALTLERPLDVHLGRLAVRPFVADLVEMHRELLVRHHVRLEIAPEACAWVDQERLQQILTNLFTNAAKYSLPGELAIGLEPEGDRLVLTVSDEGPGIDLEHQRSLFSRYARLSQSGQGAGIGLWLSRAIARQMGGDLWLSSAVGEPTSFHLALRMPPGSERQRAPATAPRGTQAG